MLTFDDAETIKNAIMKRLHEPGKTEIADIEVKNVVGTAKAPLSAGEVPHIQVGVWAILKDRIGIDGLIDTTSFFDLPPSLEHKHLLNEIDEIAEQIKVVRQETKATRLSGFAMIGKGAPRMAVSGTGLRGRWPEKARSAHNGSD